MLCEQCQARDATVHFTLVAWPAGEQAKHLCESCYPGAEAERVRSYITQPDNPLPANVDHITAMGYLDACARAAANGADKRAIKHVHRELERFPLTKERLAFEFLTMALEALDRGNDPWDLIGFGRSFGRSVGSSRLPEYTQLLESIILRSVEKLAQSGNPPSAHPFGFGLSMATLALRQANENRFTTVLEALKGRCGEGAPEGRRNIIAFLEQRIAKHE